MIQTDSAIFSRIKSWFKKTKSNIGFIILACLIIGLTYLFYWFLVMCDEIVMKYMDNIFHPLAHLLNPNLTGPDIYLRTGVYLLVAIVPLQIISIILDKVETILIKLASKTLDLKEQRLVNKTKKQFLKQFDEIVSFSICVSVECKSENPQKPSSKSVYEKIKNAFLKTKVNTNIDRTIIIFSDNFEIYNDVYEKLIQTLSKIKNQTESKENVELIFSITTDAYKINQQINFKDTERQHFEILGFSFKNKSATSALFLKKYKHINETNKHGGIPIGAFNSLDENNDKSYELNIVDKNLSKTLKNLR